jgi:hypothetical protein
MHVLHGVLVEETVVFKPLRESVGESGGAGMTEAIEPV